MNTHWQFNRSSLPAHRTLAGLTPEAAGARIGVSGQTIRNWEQGIREPRASDLAALANLYHVSPLAFCMLVRSRPRRVPARKRKLAT